MSSCFNLQIVTAEPSEDILTWIQQGEDNFLKERTFSWHSWNKTKYVGETVTAKSDHITLLSETSKLLPTKLQEECTGTQSHPKPHG